MQIQPLGHTQDHPVLAFDLHTIGPMVATGGIMRGHIQPPRNKGTATVTTVFLRPSFRITTRDGSLDVAVKAEPTAAQDGDAPRSNDSTAGTAGTEGADGKDAQDGTGGEEGPWWIAARRTSRGVAHA